MIDSAAEPEGLICAFRVSPWRELDKNSAFAASPDAPLWLHVNLLDNRGKHLLKERVPLAEGPREILLAADARARLQSFAGCFVIVLGDFYHDFNDDPEAFGALRVYVDTEMLITCRRHRLKSVDRFRARVQDDGDTASSPLELFQRLLQDLVEGFHAVSVELSEAIEDAEDQILADRAKDHASKLGQLRRLLARLRRYASANRSVLAPLPERISAWSSLEQRQHLREIVERFDAVGQDLELVTERARLLQEEITTRLNEATSRNLYLLSIVTAALLPITLITGIFGMNVGGLPFVSAPHGFGAVMVLMLATLFGTMIFLRRNGVL